LLEAPDAVFGKAKSAKAPCFTIHASRPVKRNLNRDSREITLQRWRIYCLTPHPDLLLMWAHYGGRHKGICLAFDATVSYVGGAFEVIYQQDRPVIDGHTLANSTQMAEKMMLVKSADRAYEHEYRILGRAGEFDPEPTQSIPKTKGDFF